MYVTGEEAKLNFNENTQNVTFNYVAIPFTSVADSVVTHTDSEIKTEVSKKVNEYFSIDNWDFGATFYFSELAAYLHKELGDYISSVVITPKYSSNDFTNLLSISCALNEVFMAVTTSSDVKIITQLSQSELVGE
jgi:hypothetical protein